MYTYIIIDDENLTRKGTIKKLEQLADIVCCAGEASNGAEALELIEKTNPDIIITDMNMPIMDGTELLPLLTERFPDKSLIVISGYKDYEFMKHAIKASAVDYVLKPFSKEDIQKSMQNAVLQTENKNNLHNQMLSCEEETENANYEYTCSVLKNVILGLHTERQYTITSKKLNFINDTHHFVLMMMHSDMPLEEKAVQGYLAENGFEDLALFLLHIHNRNLGFLILFLAQHSVVSPENLCRQTVRTLEPLFSAEGLHVMYGVSRTHYSLSELHDAYTETIVSLNAKRMDSAETLFFPFSETPENQPVVWGKEKEFLFRLEAGMTPSVQELLTELFDGFFAGSEYSLYQMKVYCFALADKVRYILSEYMEQVNRNSANGNMHHILDGMFSLREIKRYYIQYYTNISDVLQKQDIYADSDVVDRMKTYIARHYQEDLTIEFISCLFYMNRSYLSHLFHKKTGETFVSYLNRIRLEKAAELLTTSDKKMYQIAKSLGYDNVKYFFRVFKKYYKVTPEQYRMKHDAAET